MSRINAVKKLLLVIVALAWFPTLAAAQGAIAGQVRDNTGAVLPGAAVEASSPALIEGKREVFTDGQGQYSIVNLRPGMYTVTVSLDGFSRVVREGVQLPSNFTATVDVTLGLSALQETVTVSGASPVVDVTQNQRTTVFNRELMDAIPTSNNMWSFAQLAPGVTMNSTDVGGSSNGSDRELSAHGLGSVHTTIAVDGVAANTLRNDGRTQLYFQDLANQEMTFDTSGGSAEASAGGVRVNMIPRDGGNRRDFAGFIGGSAGSWQASNFTQRLKDAGVRSVDKVERIFDYAGTHGGPVIQNRLWYVVSARYWGTYDYQSDTFLDNGDPWRRMGDRWQVLPRFTLQATSRDKITVHYEQVHNFRGPKLTPTWPAIVNGLGRDPETASVWRDSGNFESIAQVRWMSTVTNRLLLEANAGSNRMTAQFKAQPGVIAERGTPDWYSHVQKTDQDLGTSWNAWEGREVDDARRNVIAGAASYVTGTHNLKVGVQHNWGTQPRDLVHNGDISVLNYRTGVPTTAVLTNDPAPTVERLNYDLGVYAQDRWTFNRLSVNGGVRFERVNSQVDAQDVPAGRFVPARHFESVQNVPDWFTISPRLGLAYDLFGDSKTALKFSAGRYSTPIATSLARTLNPVGLVTVSVPWNDQDLRGRALASNNDGIAQDGELDLTRLPTNFGARNLATIDPDLQRETNTELMVGIQHALTSRIAVSSAWYRRAFQNKRRIDNVERDFSDFHEVQIVSPYNGELITVYDINSTAELARVTQVIKNAPYTEVYNGFEVAGDVRMPGGGRIFGNVNTQRIIQNDCAQDDDPNLLRFCDRGNLPDLYNPVPFRFDFKLAGSVPLPLGLQVSGTFISIADKSKFENEGYGIAPEYLINRTTRYTAAQCAGRPCTAGALVIPNMILSSITTNIGAPGRAFPLAPSGTEIFLPRLNQLDLGVKKVFRARGASWEPRFDIFNVFNVDTETAYRSTQFGSSTYLLPGSSDLSNTGVIMARMPRLSLQVRW